MTSRTRGPARRRGTAWLAAPLLLGAVLLPATAAVAAPVAPDADTYVDASSPTRNYGASSALRVEGSPVRIAYLRFDTGDATSAQIEIPSTEESDDGIHVHAVADDAWQERAVTWNSRPAVGDEIGWTGPTMPGRTYRVDVSALIGSGPVSLALVSADPSGFVFGTRESGQPVRLLAPAPPTPTVYDVERTSGGYRAVSDVGAVLTGSLKFIVEQAIEDLEAGGGGTVRFGAGEFDLGSDNWELYHVHRIEFAGAGMTATVIRNRSDAAKDTEPFDFTVADEVTIRDLTVDARGAFRSTSDAIDFDAGNDSVVERVRVIGSRGRGIVFDGKGGGWTADRNRVTDCEVIGVPSDGIELLASRHNRIEGCTITDATGHGIQATKASTGADQPNKTSDDNEIVGNVVTNSGHDGINLNGANRNLVEGNDVTNSSDDVSGRDGIRVGTSDGIACNDNRIIGNRATDTQAAKTQKYGVNIATSLCARTVVEGNDLAGNLVAPLRDAGSGTIIVTGGSAESWTPTDDTYVSASAPTTAYGSRTTLRTDTDPATVSYLRFQVSGAPSGTLRTSLRLYATSSHSVGVAVHALASSAWNESTTYSTAPALGGELAHSGPLASGTWVTVDLGGLVTGDGTYEVALVGLTTTAASLGSSESNMAPELVVRPA